MELYKIITDWTKEYQILINNFFGIVGLILGFVFICGIIRFSIAIYKRHKGIYPPSSQMKDH